MIGSDYVSYVINLNKLNFATLELDEGSVLQFVNDARTDVFNIISELAPWKFMQYKQGSNSLTFVGTDNFVREDVVCVVPGSGALVPARRLMKEEIYQVQQNSFNPPSSTAPVYWLGGLTINVLPTGGNIRVYFIQRPAPLTLSATENSIPPEAVYLVIQRALLIIYEKQGMLEVVDTLQQDYKTTLKTIGETFYDSAKNTRTNFESRVNIR